MKREKGMENGDATKGTSRMGRRPRGRRMTTITPRGMSRGTGEGTPRMNHFAAGDSPTIHRSRLTKLTIAKEGSHTMSTETTNPDEDGQVVIIQWHDKTLNSSHGATPRDSQKHRKKKKKGGRR